MKRDFIVNVTDLTKGVTEQGFGLILVLDDENDIPYSLISDTGDLTSISEGITPEDDVYKMVQKIFMGSPSPVQVAVFGDSSIIDSSSLQIALDDLIDANNGGWFYLTCTNNEVENVEAMSKWASANDKLYFATVQDIGMVDGIESKNAAIGYHHLRDDYVAEGLASNLAVADPGSITAKFQEVDGSIPSDIGLTELSVLHENNGFSYINTMGRNYVSDGKTTDGSFIDIVLGSYFIKFRLEEALFLLAMNNGKIPYSNTGIGMMISEVEDVLKVATRQGIILEKDGKGVYTIDALNREEVLTNDIANRKYDGITVTATVAGAIHSATISINLVLTEEEGE